MKTERIGLFGGTFAPPHNGHVKAVKTMLRHVRLDKLIVMPTAVPPHKVKVSVDTPEIRLEMCRAAFSGIDKVEVSSYEIDKGGLSYSVDTIEHLTSENRRLFMLCGGDMFKSLPIWRRAERIFALTTIVCIPRSSGEYDELSALAAQYREKYGAKIRLIGTNPFEISSTEIREMIKNGEDLKKILPNGVESIIKREKLYSADDR